LPGSPNLRCPREHLRRLWRKPEMFTTNPESPSTTSSSIFITYDHLHNLFRIISPLILTAGGSPTSFSILIFFSGL
jgi:hypothetical protein